MENYYTPWLYNSPAKSPAIEDVFLPKMFYSPPKSQSQKCQELLPQLLPAKVQATLPDKNTLVNLSYNELYQILIQGDPQEGKNCRWLFDQFKAKQFRLEDIGRVRQDLEIYFENNSKLPVKERKLGAVEYEDIEYENEKGVMVKSKRIKSIVDYKRVKELIEPFEVEEAIEFNPVEMDDYIIIYEGPYGTLYELLTEEGACELGKGTKWCTSSKYDNRFEAYNKEGPIYVWYDNERKEKYQFHIQSGQFMDKRDNLIDPDVLDYYLNSHPILSTFFLKKMLEIIELDDVETFSKWMSIINYRWEKLEIYIFNKPKYANLYVIYVIRDRWLEAEPFIMTDPESAYEYANDIIRDRWLEAEPFIMTDPESAYEYANDIINDKWPEAEPIIMTDPKYAYLYALNFIRGRWKEAEPIIMTNPESAYLYAFNKIRSRWKEAEPIIMTDYKIAYRYARDVIKGRWLEAESLIKTNYMSAYVYARDIIGGRWKEAEPYIFKNFDISMKYISEIIQKRVPEFEELIITNPTYAYEYTNQIIKHRWLEAEPYIQKNPIIWSNYASKYGIKY